ncbi:hypothetical protein PAMA_002014 [Pampus argenteus]
MNGKVIQLVKAPMWLRGYQLCDTAQLVKEELVLSVTCCKPGPHAFIVLVEVDLPFTNTCAKAVEAHLELYGKNVWSHTVVLFTCVDWLGSTRIEEYIADEGDDLAQLLERCGQRYLTASDSTEKPLRQKLLDMVQTLVEKNEGKHFEIEDNVLQKIHKRRDEVKKRAEIRRQIRFEEKNTRENEAETSISEVTIIMLGWVFASKTRVGCAILDIPEKNERSEKCVKETRVMGKLKVTVVDTPGWWKFFSANLVPSTVKSEIMKALDQHKATENPQDPASCSQAFLLMIPVDTSFTNEQRKIVEDNMRPLGEAVWQNTILVFTSGFWLGKYCIEQHIESEGDALIRLVEKCGNRYFVFNCETTVKGDIETQVEKLLNMVKEMLSRGQSAAKEETRQTAETEDHTKVVASEEPVDEDLKKMVEYLSRIWCWRSWEVEEVVARFNERPMQVCTRDDDSMDRIIYYMKRKEVEKTLREEMRGKSLAEVMEVVSQIYFRKECGLFDIVSIISEKDTFKSEWKELFEREWGRRDAHLMVHVFQRYFTDENAFSRPAGTDKKINTIERTAAWVKEQIRRVLNECKY